jgi:hypothetical protein
MLLRAIVLLSILGSAPLGLSPPVRAQGTAARRFEDFARDPQWESYRSQLLPQPLPITRQDFGLRDPTMSPKGSPASLPADGGAGSSREIGGWIQRSLTPASFAKVIQPRTLNDRMSAAGTFAVTRDEGASGVLFGWFHETSRGWRTPNSLVFRLDGNGGKYWVFYEYGTRHWLTGGAGCFVGDRYQTTATKPFPADGTAHTWSMAYEPDGASGSGLMTFVIDGTTYTQVLLPGHKADGAEFNRFGIMNVQATGSGMEVGFHDLKLDGQPLDLTSDDRWEGRGNKTEFQDRHLRPFHDVGWSATSSRAGSNPGEIGGIMWRDEKPAYYARRIDHLGLEDELFASGRIALLGAGSDSGVYLGWFNSSSKTNKFASDHEQPQSNFLALLIEGPSRIGHFFRPAYATSKGEGMIQDSGPIIRPDGRVHHWSLHYVPKSGGIIVRLDGEAAVMAIPEKQRNQGATFDRFGLFNLQEGGHFVDIAVDDLTYTAGR